MKVVGLSALDTGYLYLPGNTSGTNLCQRLSQPQGHSAAGRIFSMKNFNDTIGNRTRDLPVYSTYNVKKKSNLPVYTSIIPPTCFGECSLSSWRRHKGIYTYTKLKCHKLPRIMNSSKPTNLCKPRIVFSVARTCVLEIPLEVMQSRAYPQM